MTVQELIEHLRQFEADLPVRFVVDLDDGADSFVIAATDPVPFQSTVQEDDVELAVVLMRVVADMVDAVNPLE